MPYRLNAKESVPEGIKRVVSQEIDSSTALLNGHSKAKRDEAVHEARKSIKKIRGVLRLFRPELGKRYAEENKRFREVGRQLSQLRDAAAQIEIFDQLAGKVAGNIERAGLAAIRSGLLRHKREIEQHLNIGKVIETAAATLAAERPRVTGWPLTGDGFDALAPGLEQTYRRGRKALRKAKKSQDPVAYHDLRKGVKDHWYHIRLLESVWTEVMAAHEASLKELETWLGDDHNLVVLSEILSDNPQQYGGKEVVQCFVAAAAAHGQELREKSISLAHRVYAEKPRRFVRSIGSLWNSRQAQPERTKNVEHEGRQQTPKKTPRAAGGHSKQEIA